MSGSGGSDWSVKVVIINTKYVETDATSFKDVVQKMTRKDSMVAYEEAQELPPAHAAVIKSESRPRRGVGSTVLRSNSSSIMMRNISFKEFDRLFREMPPMDQFWTQI